MSKNVQTANKNTLSPKTSNIAKIQTKLNNALLKFPRKSRPMVLILFGFGVIVGVGVTLNLFQGDPIRISDLGTCLGFDSELNRQACLDRHKYLEEVANNKNEDIKEMQTMLGNP